MNDRVLNRDIENILKVNFINWQELRGKTVFITGATGLIGYNLVSTLMYANELWNLDLNVLALVRNNKKACERFNSWHEKMGTSLRFINGNMEELPDIVEKIDYIIHAANETSSKVFVQQPVETIQTSFIGTWNILKLAMEKRALGVVFLSSMEVYGNPQRFHAVKENEIGNLNPLNVRNSYPISKLEDEALCCAYMKEYGIPVKILRLTQTFGPGVQYNDNRIFAYLGRCIKGHKNIVLKTKGETERCYLYTADAVTAILLVLLDGTPGEAYNAANEKTYCSIIDMAKKIADKYNLTIEYDIDKNRVNEYLDTIYIQLDTTQLQNLGWKVIGGDILQMYENMIDYWNQVDS